MRRRRIGRILIWLVAAVVALPLVAAGAGYVWWRQGLPQLNGEVTLKGLETEVRVIRDRHGVPHIFAKNRNDAARALGYLHAQDRFFQMDVSRRVAEGRLAELIGSRGLPVDKLFRTLDLSGRGAASFSSLSSELQSYLRAYADGVNAWLTSSDQALPLEYTLLGMTPEPWRPEDSVVWGKTMAWKLSANWRQDLARALLVARYDRERAERLFPPQSPDWPITLKPEVERPLARGARLDAPAGAQQTARIDTRLVERLLALPSPGAGASNEWVIDGSRTTTGKPLLANDPHLELGIPILWYLARITTPDLTITGATAPGGPLVLLGQNEHIAWGFTTTDSDAQDLFVEQEAKGQPGDYLTPDGPKPIHTETVTINIKGNDPVKMTRRETRHGPVVSDAVTDARLLTSEHTLISLAWTGLSREDTTAEAFFRINQARNWQEFQAALRYYQSPAQNIVYADRDGNTGFVNAGQVPIRKSGDGRYPQDGSVSDFDWTGTVPFDGWPKLFNPPTGAIVNANNAVIGPDYPYWFGRDQTAGYRAMRISERIGEKPKHDLDSMASIQMDIQAVHARFLVPFLLKLQPETPLEHQALDLMRGWDYTADINRPEPLILDWWLWRINQELLKSGLDPVAPEVGILNASVVLSILKQPAGFCHPEDDGADCMKAVHAAFRKTLNDLSQRYGSDAAKWRWGDEHIAAMDNQVLDNLPGFSTLFGVAFPSDGGFYSVNRGGSLGRAEEDHPLLRRSGAGYRGVYDLADPSRSRFIIATGQSGHPLSRFYADQLRLYKAGRSIRLDIPQAELMASASGVLTFKP